APLSLITHSGENQGSRQDASATAPCATPFRFPAPILAALATTRPPQLGPNSPPRPHYGPGCTPRRHRADVGVYRAPLLSFTLRIHPGQRGFGDLHPTSPAAGGNVGAASPPHTTTPPPTCPPCGAAPGGCASPRPYLRRRRPSERPHRDAPRPADTPGPPLPAPSPPV